MPPVAQAMPAPAPADRSEKPAPAPAQGKVVALDPARKSQTATPESVAILSLFFG
ncbi:MAG: hypothetical protein K0R39_3837 [Symbiobacteriaceae bacterium]|nr:hypothetical protein [Symbiobacteriaceae bacterium]